MVLFIPIKKESQRVPNKNFRNFGGYPLYKHCLAKYFDHKVFVDTDSEDLIQEISIDPDLEHVTAYYRDPELMGHNVSVNLLIDSFLKRFNPPEEEPVGQIHVTSPFLTLGTLEKAVGFLKEKYYDSVFSVDRIQARCWRVEDRRSIPINHNPAVLEQTQDINPIFVENSSFYLFTPLSFSLNGRNRVGKKPYFYEISYPENLDIDTEENWKTCCRVLLENGETN